MMDEKMCCAILFSRKQDTDFLMARVGDVASVEALEKEGCHSTDFIGRPMKGYVFVTPDGYDLEDDLEYYVQACISFNPFAKSSKKKSK